MFTVNSVRLLSSIEDLGRIGFTEGSGISRVCLTQSDVAGKNFVYKLMQSAGLHTYFDEVANVVGILNATADVSPIFSGSHTDTVIGAGRLDGSYGVLAAIEAANSIRGQGVPVRRPLGVISFTNEEGVRFPPMIGSKYFTGESKLDDILQLRDASGVTVREALNGVGVRHETTKVMSKAVKGFLELHIEQGPILEEEHIQIGVVESIVGMRQFIISVQGSADHAGTTPMNLRKDALLVASQFIIAVHELRREIAIDGVVTVGKLEVKPNVANVVPALVNFSVDFRHKSNDVLAQLETRLNSLVEEFTTKTRLCISAKNHFRLPPVKLSSNIANLVEDCAKDLGLSSMRMQSGAGHDSMNVNKIAETGMIFVPSKGGKSHTPLEDTNSDDLVNGTNVLCNALVELLNSR